MNSSLYALILAGGSGERFWPLSRKAKPKQLLHILSETTLLEETLARLEGFLPLKNIIILTNREQEKAVRDLVKSIPHDNIIVEPEKRDTAAAIALGVGIIAKHDCQATMIVLPADHLIRDTAAFQKTLLTGIATARETGCLTTIGIKPTWACPGYGYIEQGKAFTVSELENAQPVFEVVRFREKPSSELAETFLKQSNFRWNAGMFIWTVPAIISIMKRYAPEPLSELIAQLYTAKDTTEVIREKFSKLPKLSIDYAVMEKADRVLVVESGFDWDDIGGWPAIAKYLRYDEQRNASNTTLSALNASENIVFSATQKHVALLGVDNLIVVQTDDAILVCNRHDAEKIKRLMPLIPPEYL